MRVVVIEDHQDLREVFIDRLLSEGFNVVGASCAGGLDEQLAAAPTHLIVLDVNLPGESGFDIAQRLRAGYPSLNIIMVSARTEEQDRIRGYESGADFYLTKPVSPAELSAAVKAVRRRVEALTATGRSLVLNPSRLKLSLDGRDAHLSKSDTALLKGLALAPDLRLPYWRLFEITERIADGNSKSQLELQVHRLRKKLEEIGVPDTFIRSIRSEGYQLTLPILIEN